MWSNCCHLPLSYRSTTDDCSWKNTVHLHALLPLGFPTQPAVVLRRKRSSIIVPQGLSPQVMNLLKNPSDPVLAVLADMDEWQFDIFRLDEASDGWPLSTLAVAIMRKCNLAPGR